MISTNKFTDDVIVLPVYDHQLQLEIVTSKDKVDAVIAIGNPNICMVVINKIQYNINLPAQKVSDMIYGALGA